MKKMSLDEMTNVYGGGWWYELNHNDNCSSCLNGVSAIIGAAIIDSILASVSGGAAAALLGETVNKILVDYGVTNITLYCAPCIQAIVGE